VSAALHVLVVDDHPTVRAGLTRILTSHDASWQVTGAEHAQAALSMVAQQAFDVGIVDMSMSGMNGLELVRRIRERRQRLPLLMLSMHAEEAYALRAFRAGVCGYITKDRAAEELVRAVQSVAVGGTWIPAGLQGRVHVNAQGIVEVGPHAGLTDRELQVLRHLARAEAVPQVAHRMHLPEAAVVTARHRILDKLGLSTDVELAEYATTHRLLP